MPSGKHKSRTLRRVYVRTPKKGTKLVYKKRKSGYAKCTSCGIVLKGMKKDTPSKLRNLAKTKKRRSRLYRRHF